MKKGLKITGIVAGSVIGVLGLGYLLGAILFNNRLMPGSTVNGIAAGNQTAQSLNQVLIATKEPYVLNLNLQDGSQVRLEGDSFGYQYDFSDDINKVISSQKPLEWGWYLLNPTAYQASAVGRFDEANLQDAAHNLDCFHIAEKNAQAEVKIVNKMNKYSLQDGREDVLEDTVAEQLIVDAVANMSSECNLSSAYVQPDATDAQKSELDRFAQIEKIQDTVIQYADGDVELTLDKYVFMPWVEVGSDGMPILNSDGSVNLDEEKVATFVTRLADTYNTDQKPRKWQKYKGGVVEIPCQWDGYIVDEEAETAAIIKAVSHGESQSRKPIFSQEGRGRGNAEVGDTYVEVDMGNQKVYFFENGKLKMESDTVTGNKRYHYDTPAMMTDIYFMQEGRTLRGENYATFVYYWMAFYNHYGLHDATWRSKFGGDIYKTDGSHGCVNLPKDFAGKLYECVQVGTPVVLYN